MNRLSLLAVLFAGAAFALTPTTVQAAPSSYVWSHASPIYVGRGAPSRTHGTTIGSQGGRVFRNWYSSGAAWRR